MTQILERTVLFADLRGSTAMYETPGTAEATTGVTHSVRLPANTVESNGGTVVKTLGDGLMAMFPRPSKAVAAADEMHDRLARLAAQNDDANAAKLRLVPLKLQV